MQLKVLQLAIYSTVAIQYLIAFIHDNSALFLQYVVSSTFFRPSAVLKGCASQNCATVLTCKPSRVLRITCVAVFVIVTLTPSKMSCSMPNNLSTFF